MHIQGPNFANSSLRFLNEAGSNPDFWNIGVRDFGSSEYFSFERNGSETHMVIEDDIIWGISNPTNRLHVIDNVDGDARIMLGNQNTRVSNQATIWAEADGNNAFMRAFGDNHSTKSNVVEMGTTASGTDLSIFANSERMKIASSGVVSINNLSGGATEMVVANSNGELSKQNIPSGNDKIKTKLLKILN